MKFLFIGLYVLGIYGAFIAGSIQLRSSVETASEFKTKLRFPKSTILLIFLVAIPSAVQIFHPAILFLLQRDFPRFMQGEWWRLITPLFVQDGGIAGTGFNLTSLLLVGILAEQLWGSLPVLLIFFIGGMIGEIAGFAWQPVGAGNSVANFALAGSILVACLLHKPGKPVLIFLLATMSVYLLLIGIQDIHGVAAAAGMLVALVFGFLFQWAPKAQNGNG